MRHRLDHDGYVCRRRLATAVLAWSGIVAVGPGSIVAQSRQARSESLVQEYARDHQVPGLAVAIGSAGELAYTAAFGWADLEMEVSVTDRTLFRTASVLKPMTATLVAMLAQEGTLDLDAPVRTYCPAYPVKRWPIPLRDLIAHAGGVRPSEFADIFNRDHYSSVTAALARFSDDTLHARPGTRMEYSNAGYTLLACAIEGATGRSFDEALRRRVLDPAGMTRTVRDNPLEVIPYRARGYMVRTEENTAQWEGLWQPRHLEDTPIGMPFNADAVDPTWSPGAGGYLTTPADLVRFASALLEGRLLAPELVERIAEPVRLTGGQAVPRSHGWFLGEFDGRPVLHVLGSDWNGSSGLWVLPGERLVIAVSTNKGFEQPAELIEALARVWRTTGR